uniref:E3 ubiquitin-protein ligase MARCHF8 n=1 Tax=Erigeron canadensis TaxID=72917 RepID=UPI001CB8B919|nr:E3 ubiquitin-protein ligase MARCHF8 [Erigeron canadensis]
MMTEVRLNIYEDDDSEQVLLYSTAAAPEMIICRICHEAEDQLENSTLESPCSCSGTVKYAHRDCVQRWCDEKGNTNCEICLQKFEPGYSAPPPKKDVHTIRGSLEVPRADEDLETTVITEDESLAEREHEECSSAADTTASIFRTLALIFTVLLLIRHFIGVLIGETGDYPFTLLTLLLIKACGILLPMYIIMRVIDVVHNSITRPHQDSENATLQRTFNL